MSEFLPISGFPGYQISRDAVVLGKRGKPLKPQWTGWARCPYLTITLRRPNGKNRRCKLHHLVLETFVGPRPPGMEGRHLNDDRADNALDNLAWGTPSENVLDKVRNGNHPMAQRASCPSGHDYTPENTIRVGPQGRWRRCGICYPRKRA